MSLNQTPVNTNCKKNTPQFSQDYLKKHPFKTQYGWWKQSQTTTWDGAKIHVNK